MDERRIVFARPDIRPEDEVTVLAILRSGRLTQGPQVEAFEEELGRYVGAPYAVAVSSGMAALHVAYLAMGIKREQRVLCPALSHVATACAIEAVGGWPTFVDCERETGNTEVSKMSGLPCGPVHYAGIPAAVWWEKGKPVVEDCALALGATLPKLCATMVRCYSFHPAKHITTGEGGMLVTADRGIAEKARALRSFGYGKRVGQYDVDMVGYNFRMPEVGAAIGRAQLRRMPEMMERRRSNWERLSSELQAQGFEVVGAKAQGQAYAFLTAYLPIGIDQQTFLEGMKSQGIELAVHYPVIPRLRYFEREYGECEPGSFPNAERIADHSVSFPVGPHLGEEDMAYMTEMAREYGHEQ